MSGLNLKKKKRKNQLLLIILLNSVCVNQIWNKRVPEDAAEAKFIKECQKTHGK